MQSGLRKVPNPTSLLPKQSRYGQGVKAQDNGQPYIFKCFQAFPWAKYLYPQPCSRFDIQMTFRMGDKANELPPERMDTLRPGPVLHHAQITVGDIVAIAGDSAGAWKHQGHEWLAYV